AQRVVFPRRNLHLAMPVGGVLGAVDDHKVAVRAWRTACAHGDGINLDYQAVIYYREPPVGDADHDLALADGRHANLSLRGRRFRGLLLRGRYLVRYLVRW